MRYAILSDVHANLEALDAVLTASGAAGVDEIVVLGDLVGYNADPAAVLVRLREQEHTTLLAGNHDMAATERFDASWFNPVAKAAIEWTQQTLDDETLAALAALEPSRMLSCGLCVHGSPREPAIEYITNTNAARSNFDAAEFDLCFFGHTHLPTAFTLSMDGEVEASVLADGRPFAIPEGSRALLNPGSVGQPRDGDARASFMVFDDETRIATVHRVGYEIEETQRKIREAGLPDALADRLAVGR